MRAPELSLGHGLLKESVAHRLSRHPMNHHATTHNAKFRRWITITSTDDVRCPARIRSNAFFSTIDHGSTRAVPRALHLGSLRHLLFISAGRATIGASPDLRFVFGHMRARLITNDRLVRA